MDLWILYAITTGIFFGLSSFISKISAHKNLNKAKMILFGSYVSLILSGLYFFINYRYVEVTFFLIFLMVIRIIGATQKHLFIIDSLKYIETSLFFPIHKIIQIFATFLIGILLFDEYLSKIELLTVFLGILMILLLSSRENKKKQINYEKGIYYLLLANFALLFSSTINKYIGFINFDIPTYIFYSSIIGNIYLLTTQKDIYKKSDKNIFKDEVFYGIIRGILLLGSFTTLLLSLKTGPFVLVSIITSIGIFIPIILSIIFYHEKINISKILAFILLIIIIALLVYK